MHTLSAIFLLFLCSFNAIVSIRVVSSIDYKAAQQKIQTQLTQLMMDAQADDTPLTLDDFEKSIEKILTGVQETQDKHEEISKRMMSQCKEEETFRRSEIHDAKMSFQASSNALGKCQDSLDAATANLPKLKQAKRDYEKLLVEKTRERRRAHLVFEALQKDWAEAIVFLIDFNRVVRHTDDTTGFSQLTQTLIQHMAKVGKIAQLAPIFIELTNKAGDDKLAGLSALVENLKNQLVVDQKMAQVEEARQQKLFEELKENIHDILKALGKNIDRTSKQIVSMNACVASEKAIMYAAASKMSRNEKLLKLGLTTCTDFAKEFVSATKNRLAEINVLKQIIAIIKKRYGQLNPKMVGLINGMADDFVKYMNLPEFKAYQEYVKVRIAENKHGEVLVDKHTLK